MYMCVPWLWWQTGSRSRSMNIASSCGWQPARKRSTMEERDAVAALPWNLLPALVRIRPYRILHNNNSNNPQTLLTTQNLTEYLTKKWTSHTHLMSIGISWGRWISSTTVASSEMLKRTISSLKCLSSSSRSRFSLENRKQCSMQQT